MCVFVILGADVIHIKELLLFLKSEIDVLKTKILLIELLIQLLITIILLINVTNHFKRVY